MIHKFFITGLIILLSLSAIADEKSLNYEQSLLQTIDDIQQLNHDQALADSREFIQQYPTSKVGQLLFADLLMAKAGVLSGIGAGISSESGLDNLTFEIKQRLSRKQAPAFAGYLPENIIQMAANQPYAILIDQSQSRLYVYRNQQGTPVLEADYFLTIGLKGYGKQKRGDQKTPIGVYHVTRYIDDKKLPDLYGRGAYPVNYPNQWDIRKKRNGGGIWLHGTPSYTYNRAPWASNGCMVVSNHDLLDIQQYIEPELHTPVINVEKVNWVSMDQWHKNQKTMLKTLSNWINDWESNIHHRYTRHYSKTDLNVEGRNYNQWEGHKRWVNRDKKDIRIEYRNLNIYRYPGEENLVLMQYDQHYESNNLNTNSRKELYWQKQSNDWKIVYEGARYFSKTDDNLVEN